jgi:chromosomal replication initiation ATPase DnaA
VTDTPEMRRARDDDPRDSTNEPIEVKLIAAASDGYVRVTPEKCERIHQLIAAALQEARWEAALEEVERNHVEWERLTTLPVHKVREMPQYCVICKRSAESQVSPDEIMARDNRWHIVKVRRVFAQSARTLGYSLPAIGAALHRHHTTVMNLLESKRR